MNNLYWLIDKLPIPIILHEKNKILHANDAFKNFLSEEQNIESLELTLWLAEVIKTKENLDLLINSIDKNDEAIVTTESYVKSTLHHWTIVSFPLPKQFSEKTRMMYLQDMSASQNKKSYWDLHLRVSKATMQLIKEMAERKKLEIKTAELNNQLIITARRAGMADVATSVLHNIGNMLNSVKTSIALIMQNINKIEFSNLTKIVTMIHDHLDDLNKYFIEDPKGKLIPEYLTKIVQSLAKNQESSNSEMQNLMKYLQHIEDIVAMQESTSGVVKVSEKILISETVDSAIQLCGGIFEKNNIEVQKQYGDNLCLISDKFKILQILVNLLQNAKDALLSPNLEVPVKIIHIKIEKNHKDVVLSIRDNGIGIASENVTKIFSLGFTTKENGHGFGLHSSALAAKELGGSLNAISNGIGLGATFILTLPI